ncbi:MAG TPA: TatD family hydrolase [Bacillota bacterium]|jgi:hypothetical protein
MIDSHLHLDLMSYKDVDDMLGAGIHGAVACSYVFQPSSSGTVIDHYRMLVAVYRAMAAARGFTLGVALGLHPRGIPPDWSAILDALPDWLARPGVVALGEIGLDWADGREKEVLEAEFKLAAQLDKRVVVHLPGTNRETAVGVVLDLAEKAGLNPASMVVDHVGPDVLGSVKAAGCRIGLTVKPGRLSPEDVLTMLHSGIDLSGAMLNSDAANLKASDPLAVALTAAHLRRAGVDETVVAALAGGNARDFFGLSREGWR